MRDLVNFDYSTNMPKTRVGHQQVSISLQMAALAEIAAIKPNDTLQIGITANDGACTVFAVIRSNNGNKVNSNYLERRTNNPDEIVETVRVFAFLRFGLFEDILDAVLANIVEAYSQATVGYSVVAPIAMTPTDYRYFLDIGVIDDNDKIKLRFRDDRLKLSRVEVKRLPVQPVQLAYIRDRIYRQPLQTHPEAFELIGYDNLYEQLLEPLEVYYPTIYLGLR